MLYPLRDTQVLHSRSGHPSGGGPGKRQGSPRGRRPPL